MPDTAHRPVPEALRALIELVNPWLPEDGAQPPVAADEPAPDWCEVLAYARRHRVVPFAASRLGQRGLIERLPTEIALAFEREAQAATYHEMAMLAELRRVQGAFDGAGVEFLVIKGLVLSATCYGQLGLRVNRDIDLLVPATQLAPAHAALAGLGFTRIEPAGEPTAEQLASWTERNKDWVYSSPRGLVIELHHRLFDNPTLNDSGVLGRSRRVSLFGQAEVRALGAADEVAYLAMHGALHSWSRLKWLLDLAFLFRRIGPAALHALLLEYRSGPAARALQQAVGLCTHLFGTPPALLEKRSWIDDMLVSAAWRAIAGSGVSELEDTRFGTTLKNASHYLLWSNPRFWMAELAYDLTDTSRDLESATSKMPIWLSRSTNWIVRHGINKRF